MKPFALEDEAIARLLFFAFELALRSPDPSTQNGAVVVDPAKRTIGAGCNEFPSGVGYSDERWERPGKYQWIEHAERNAIYTAAFRGSATGNATMVCPWAACADCARAIVQSGISRLIRLPFPLDASGERWRQSCEVGDTIMREAGVEIIEFAGGIGHVSPIRRDGQLWQPA